MSKHNVSSTEAENNPSSNSYQLGLEHYFGFNSKPPNFTLAFEYFLDSATSPTDTKDEKSKNDHIYSMIMLSKCYLLAHGVAESEEEGLTWLVKAANGDNDCMAVSNAKNDLAMLIIGNIKSQNPDAVREYCESMREEDEQATTFVQPANSDANDDENDDHYSCADAVKLLIEAADGGYPAARTNLGSIYEEAGDLEQAHSCYSVAEQHGCCRAKCLLASLYLRPSSDAVSNSSKVQQKAFDLLASAALNGITQSFCLMGECYLLGRGTSKDLDEAVHYYRKGAKAGDSMSMFRLAKLLLDIADNPRASLSEGTEADDNPDPSSPFITDTISATTAEAVQWMRSASALGHVDATVELGKMYECAQAGVPAEDSHTALTYYQAAADAGHGEAAFFAANILYSQASQFAKLELMLRAADLYRRAAELGNKSAMNCYAILLEDGLTNAEGIAFPHQAAGWYYAAAMLGERKAYINLAALLASSSMVSFKPVVGDYSATDRVLSVLQLKSSFLSDYFTSKAFEGTKEEREKGLEFVAAISVDPNHDASFDDGNILKPVPLGESPLPSSPTLSSVSKKSTVRNGSNTPSIESGTIDRKKIPRIRCNSAAATATIKEVRSSGSNPNISKMVSYTTEATIIPPNDVPKATRFEVPSDVEKPPSHSPPVIAEQPHTLSTMGGRRQQLVVCDPVTAPLHNAGTDMNPAGISLDQANSPDPIEASQKDKRDDLPAPTTVSVDRTSGSMLSAGQHLIQTTTTTTNQGEAHETIKTKKKTKKVSFITKVLGPFLPFNARRHEKKYTDDGIAAAAAAPPLVSIGIEGAPATPVQGNEASFDAASSLNESNELGDPTSDLSLSSREVP